MKWTKEQEELLSKLYPDTKTEELCKILNLNRSKIYNKAFQMGLQKSESYLKANVYTIKPSEKTMFKKGHEPWNKGVKGLDIGGKQTQFKKGHRPNNWKPEGSERIDVDGFIMIKINGKYVPKHRHVWEQENGPVPKGYVVYFKDGDKQNVQIDNMGIMTKKENMKRNSILNLPEELQEIINLKKTITKLITENGKRQNSRS